jgi:integrase
VRGTARERPGRKGEPLPAFPIRSHICIDGGVRRLHRPPRSELAGLETADLEFAPVRVVGAQPKCSVRIERTKTKGKRTGEGWIVGTPKSKRSRRTVPLPGWLAAKMADYLAHDHTRTAEPDAP